MILNELFHKDEYVDRLTQNQLNDPGEDQSKPALNDLRKTKLTLGEINKIRRMLDIRNYEMKKKIDKVQKIYGQSSDDSGGGGLDL